MLISHSSVVDYLTRAWAKGTLSHGYLFYGPRHVGKTTVATELAKTLICERQESFGGCLLAETGGRCAACRRMSGAGDPRFIKLELGQPLLLSEKDKTEIGIKEIREVRRRLSLRAANWQIALILDAENLSSDAANALLKILEEPHERTIFLFVSSRPSYLPPTVVSRLIQLRFSLAPDEDMRKTPGAIPELVTLASGRPGILLRLINDPVFRKIQSERYRLAENIVRSSVGRALLYSERIADDSESREEVVHYLCRMAQDQYRGKNPGAAAPRRIRSALSAFEALETTNVNRRLASDVICISFSRGS